MTTLQTAVVIFQAVIVTVMRTGMLQTETGGLGALLVYQQRTVVMLVALLVMLIVPQHLIQFPFHMFMTVITNYIIV
jgi:hypothetical protein